MKLIGKAVTVALLAAAAVSTANAAYVTTFTSGQTTEVAGATVVDFEGGMPAG